MHDSGLPALFASRGEILPLLHIIEIIGGLTQKCNSSSLLTSILYIGLELKQKNKEESRWHRASWTQAS